MNKRETAEIKRRFTIENTNISCIRGCYVNEKREIISRFTASVPMLPQEEAEKYLSIFKRTISGSFGKNLNSIDFTVSQVSNSKEHELLTRLRKTELKDDDTVNEFFSGIIEKVNFEGNYLILLMHETYDVPVRAKDGMRTGESDSQYSYIMCSVCPVKMTKPFLGFDLTTNSFRSRGTDWAVFSPEVGFLFPAFDSRKTNIYGALYYTRDGSGKYSDFAKVIFSSDPPMPAEEQKELFCAVLTDSLGDECNYDVIRSVNEKLNTMIEEHDKDKTDPEPLRISKLEVRNALEECGVSEMRSEAFGEKFDEAFGAGADISPLTVAGVKKYELRTPEAVVHIDADHGDLVSTRVIDGVKYVLIRADGGVEVNGISVNINDD